MPTPHPLEALIPYAVAAGLGALVGLERQYSASQSEQPDAAGVRTHAMWGVVGVLAAQLSDRPGWEYLYVVGLVATGILLGVANILKFLTTGDRGVTTELSQLAVFLIAALVEGGEYRLAIPLSVGLTVMLRAKESLHHLSETFGPREINATIRFAVIAGAILPFLPDQGMGPLEAFNPFKIWQMVVLVAGISFFGYMMVLFVGHRGIEITGILAGFISSTAAAIQLSRQSRDVTIAPPYVRAMLLAASISFLRVLLLVGVVGSPELLLALTPPLLAVSGVGFVMVLLLGQGRVVTDTPDVRLTPDNPLRLTSVLTFGAAYAVILFLVRWAQERWSEEGILALSAISGISGVSAITLSLSDPAHGTPPLLAARGILLACATATLVKCGFVIALGSASYRLWTTLGLSAMAATAIGFAMWWLS